MIFGGGAEDGLYFVTMKPPRAASKIPKMNGIGMAENPPLGGCIAMPTMAFTMGAPAKTIDMTEIATTAGFIPAFAPDPIASRTKNAPIAPKIPAKSEIHIPFGGMFQFIFFEANRITSGARTAVRK